jgi:hypothetical protein
MPSYTSSPLRQAAAPLVKPSYLHAPFLGIVHYHRLALGPSTPSPRVNPPPPPLRGTVHEFSRASRRRVIDRLQCIRLDLLDTPVWVTLTFHEGWRSSPTHVRHVFLAWLMRLRRRWPMIYYMWRLQLQKRGAPHWHLILWPAAHSTPLAPEALLRWIYTSWHACADPTSPHHAKHGTKAEYLNHQTAVYRYVSKYVAKVDLTLERSYTGRRWGNSRDLPLDPLTWFPASDQLYTHLKRLCRRYLRHRITNRQFHLRTRRRDQGLKVFWPHLTTKTAWEWALSQITLTPQEVPP